MCITYSCHSAARRAQFSIREGETFESEGREAKRKIMQRASSMSRTASIKKAASSENNDMKDAIA